MQGDRHAADLLPQIEKRAHDSTSSSAGRGGMRGGAGGPQVGQPAVPNRTAAASAHSQRAEPGTSAGWMVEPAAASAARMPRTCDVFCPMVVPLVVKRLWC